MPVPPLHWPRHGVGCSTVDRTIPANARAFDVGEDVDLRLVRRRSRVSRFQRTTTGADETNIFHGYALDLEKKLKPIAAQRIVPLRRTSGLRQFMKIARVLAMIENDLLI